MNILLIGSGAREHALARAIKKSPQNSGIFCFGSDNNPGIRNLSSGYQTGKIIDPQAVLNFAKKNNIDFAIIGPEAPMAAGVADVLLENNIPCVGHKKKLAQIETSKGFTRDLLTEYKIQGSPKYKRFYTIEGVKKFLEELGELYVVKADGLMGGKGVKVAGDHLRGHEEAISYCHELIDKNSSFVIEEKLIGQEFSLMCFCDGAHLVHMPPVQDHKRAFDNDLGPNTGGMGSYSDANHLLPFLKTENIEEAKKINRAVIKAIKNKFNEEYKGILYGGFMATKNGTKLIEYNVRFGDPEAMNALSVLESDFVGICQMIIAGTLDEQKIKFANKATVCKYAVPEGYPDNPVKNQKIDISAVRNQENLYYASVDEKEDGLYEVGSRAIAIVGIADTIYEAEKIAEKEINKIKGPLFHRRDIGTKELINKRIEMMKNL